MILQLPFHISNQKGSPSHHVLIFSMLLFCSFDLGTGSRTVFHFSTADFDGLRDHFSKYDDWTLLIDLDINEDWNFINDKICNGMIKFISKVSLRLDMKLIP